MLLKFVFLRSARTGHAMYFLREADRLTADRHLTFRKPPTNISRECHVTYQLTRALTRMLQQLDSIRLTG